MLISKNVDFIKLIKIRGKYMVWLMLFMGLIAILYYLKVITIAIPWLPVSVIGTAVAFYVGFKNNQAYDRMWEARKIWGGIINDSRSWGMLVDGYLTNIFIDKKMNDDKLLAIKKRLVYRHIGWLYAHRSQLLIPTTWENNTTNKSNKHSSDEQRKKFGVGLIS